MIVERDFHCSPLMAILRMLLQNAAAQQIHLQTLLHLPKQVRTGVEETGWGEARNGR